MQSTSTPITQVLEIKIEQPPIQPDATPKTQLQYFYKLTESEIKKTEELYHLKIEELDEKIHDYRFTYYLKRGKYILALGTNFLYIIFQATTAKDGVPNFVRVFVPSANVPPIIGQLIGYPSAILDCLTYALNFSERKVALAETLEYIAEPPFKDRISNTLQFARNQPIKALYETTKFSFNESLLLFTNIASIMTEIIDIADGLKSLTPALRWILTLSILRFGVAYMQKYINVTYYKELKEYWTNPDIPWVALDLLKKGELATLLQIIIQAVISTAGIKAFPFYYYVALASESALGWFPPPIALSAAIALVNMIFLYPSTVREYLSDTWAIEKIIKQHINTQEVDRLVQDEILQLHFPAVHSKIIDYEIKKITLTKTENIRNQFVENEMRARKEKIIEEHGQTYFIKDSRIVLYMATRGFIGGFVGYMCVSPLLLLIVDAPIAVPALSITACSLAFMDMMRRVQQKRVDAKLIRDDLEGKKPEPEKKLSTFVKLGASLIIAGNGASTSMSTMGTLSLIPGSTSPWLRSFIALVSIDNMIVTMGYNWKSTSQTFNNLFNKTEVKPSSNSSTLFQPCKKTEAKENPIKTSWFSCRRGRGQDT